MLSGNLIVKYITPRNCFCYVSTHNFKSNEEGVVIKLTCSYNALYFSCRPLLGLKENEIGLNSLFAQKLCLTEGDNVFIEVVDYIPGTRHVTVSPETQDDYEILELLAENIEMILLNQIRVINKNQKFIIWVTDSVHVTVNVDDMDPVSLGLLDNLTEVAVALPHKTSDANITRSEKITQWQRFNKWTKFFKPGLFVEPNLLENSFDKFLNLHSLLSFILYPIEDLKIDNCQPFKVYVLKKDLPPNFLSDSLVNDIFILKIIIPPVTNNNYIEESSLSIKTVLVQLCILENHNGHNSLFLPILYVHKCLYEHFGLKIGSKAALDKFIPTHSSVKEINVSTNRNNTNTVKEKLKTYLSTNCESGKVILNSDFTFEIEPQLFVSLKFSPDINYWVVDSNLLRNTKITVSKTELFVEDLQSKNKPFYNYALNCGNYGEIMENCLSVFKCGLITNKFDVENVLIIGKTGTGKSILIDILSGKLTSHPFYIHTEKITCKNVKGKSLDSLHKILTSKIMNLMYYQPSVLILDDLHIICEKTQDDGMLTQETLHINRISEMLAEVLDYLKYSNIGILATAESILKLNKSIFHSRGQHIFKNVFYVGELTKDDRSILLKSLFKSKCILQDVDLEEVSLKAEGFVTQDLVNIVNKAVYESLKEDVSDNLIVTTKHCEMALNNTTALSLRDVQLQSPGERDFSDIGGLEDVKKILVECMMWPVQYPNLFGRAPLRQQSGLLLYGPPGTGKTILAGAAAKHCSLRLISIKGPELLSKYIGASELAVRNVFDKAQSARPCILFFDEFDSIAPRRGHDSTGVTDRVVNQLLTQLDGVESLSGVCVLAATSRPDLLDPALLRPGRLDRQILCPLPNEEARMKILMSLSKKMVLEDNIDLQKIAEKTDGYSGADLQSVLYTAQLSAAEHLLEEAQSNDVNGIIEIKQRHVDEALENTRPSLTKEEKLKYQKIYSRFQQRSDLIDFKSGVQKATLA